MFFRLLSQINLYRLSGNAVFVFISLLHEHSHIHYNIIISGKIEKGTHRTKKNTSDKKRHRQDGRVDKTQFVAIFEKKNKVGTRSIMGGNYTISSAGIH